jgi:hypothetical protein
MLCNFTWLTCKIRTHMPLNSILRYMPSVLILHTVSSIPLCLFYKYVPLHSLKYKSVAIRLLIPGFLRYMLHILILQSILSITHDLLYKYVLFLGLQVQICSNMPLNSRFYVVHALCINTKDYFLHRTLTIVETSTITWVTSRDLQPHACYFQFFFINFIITI